MISINPGYAARQVETLLRDAERTAGNILGSGADSIEIFNSYLTWSSSQARILGPAIGSDDIDRILTTRRHWSIQAVDPGARMSTIGDFVRLELTECQAALGRAADLILDDVWHWQVPAHGGAGRASVAAIVLDTNVVLRHQHELSTFAWRSKIETAPDSTIALTVPVAVIRELDRLKLSNHKMRVYDQEVPVRSLARQALRMLDGHFENSDRLAQLTEEGTRQPSLWMGLLLDEYDHNPLATVDAEIMDRTLAFTSVVGEVWLATYDRGLFFESRRAGLKAIRLDDGE
jgi:hypothetical protein